MNRKELAELRVLLVEAINGLKDGAPQEYRNAIADKLRIIVK